MKSKTAEISIDLPRQEREKPVSNIHLRWWNTHYKSAHLFFGDRVEVLLNLAHRNFHKWPVDRVFSLACPYCKKGKEITVGFVNGVKGQIKCSTCKKEFGIHPSGQMFIVKEADKKDRPVDLDRKIVLKKLRMESYQRDWDMQEGLNQIVLTASSDNDLDLKNRIREMTDYLEENGIKYEWL